MQITILAFGTCPALGHIGKKDVGPRVRELGSWIFIPLAWPVGTVRKSSEFCSWPVSRNALGPAPSPSVSRALKPMSPYVTFRNK